MLAYVIPVTDRGLSIFGLADLCNSTLGVIGQALSNRIGADCAWAGLAADGLVATGLLGLSAATAGLVLLNIRR